MNATLGGTGSQSDQIVINGGKATGQTLLTIRNVGGIGAQTSGAGIPVIVAVNGGTIARNAFALADSPVVGGYRYTLDQNGQDLYLVSAPTTDACPVGQFGRPASPRRSSRRSSPAGCSARSCSARRSR